MNPPRYNTTTETARGDSPAVGDLGKQAVATRARWADFYELTKPRLSLLSVMTAVVGYLAADPARNVAALSSLLLGTSLAAAGAAVINQWLEREADARMARTRDRPVAAGRMAPRHALLYGLALGAGGCALLFLGATPLAGSLAAATIASYALLYTPLKRVTAWNTVVGALPGALPPLIGWAAAEGRIAPLGWCLFAILFLWQLPHFFAIAWRHRDDYARGGFVMLPAVDPSGRRVARRTFAVTMLLIAASLGPVALGDASPAFAGAALGCGWLMARPAWTFTRPDRRNEGARRLFVASIVYLPALLALLVVDLTWIAPAL